MTQPQLICKNLSLGYNSKEIAHTPDFTINAGDYLCIVGENGSGKTTLMKTILGLNNPLSGTIETSGGIKRHDIGYLPQQTPLQRDFPASVREIVLSGCQNKRGRRPFYSKSDKTRTAEVMRKLSITDISQRCYRELSGGQQQRVLLARALCAAEKILLLDEPTAGLDPIITTHLYSVIEELNKKDGITVIMISHDISAAIKYATHILHIGRNTFFGTTKDYLESDIGRAFSVSGGAL